MSDGDSLEGLEGLMADDDCGDVLIIESTLTCVADRGAGGGGTVGGGVGGGSFRAVRLEARANGRFLSDVERVFGGDELRAIWACSSLTSPSDRCFSDCKTS